MRRSPLLMAVTLLAGGLRAAAAQESTRYLPIASWVTPYVEYLVRADVLRGIDPLTRPLRRAEVARALAAVDTTSQGQRIRELLRLVSAEVADPPASGVRWTLEPRVAALGASDASRSTLRPVAGGARLYPALQLGGILELPHLALVTTPTLDTRLLHDPWYRGKKDRFVAGRNDAAYVLFASPGAELFFGSIDRNWGPTDVEGLLVSPSPYATEHLMVRLGPPALRLEMLMQQLDQLVPWDSTVPVDRWLVSHRLVLRPSPRLEFALDESGVIGGAAVPWRYLNPLTLALLTQFDGGGPENALFGASFAWQARAATRFFGQLMIDDFQVDRRSQGDSEPTAWAMTLGASGGWRGGGATWTTFYTRVSNLAYRSRFNEEQYSLNGVGLARNFSDYDQLTLRASSPLRPRLLVGAEVNVIRQGEGDFRRRYPDVSAFSDTLAFLTGTVERKVNVALEATWAPRPDATLRGWLGYDALSNADHVVGARDRRWVWRLSADWHPRWRGAVR